mmetsp:Transcript_70409/g.195962  ORF Transcript_70409/g.195962 Transcript_70409/m.195962 type:complete len:369 (-) Transcript_70409:63-1169(-)
MHSLSVLAKLVLLRRAAIHCDGLDPARATKAVGLGFDLLRQLARRRKDKQSNAVFFGPDVIVDHLRKAGQKECQRLAAPCRGDPDNVLPAQSEWPTIRLDLRGAREASAFQGVADVAWEAFYLVKRLVNVRVPDFLLVRTMHGHFVVHRGVACSFPTACGVTGLCQRQLASLRERHPRHVRYGLISPKRWQVRGTATRPRPIPTPGPARRTEVPVIVPSVWWRPMPPSVITATSAASRPNRAGAVTALVRAAAWAPPPLLVAPPAFSFLARLTNFATSPPLLLPGFPVALGLSPLLLVLLPLLLLVLLFHFFLSSPWALLLLLPLLRLRARRLRILVGLLFLRVILVRFNGRTRGAHGCCAGRWPLFP